MEINLLSLFVFFLTDVFCLNFCISSPAQTLRPGPLQKNARETTPDAKNPKYQPSPPAIPLFYYLLFAIRATFPNA
jgi:hypothetical protein